MQKHLEKDAIAPCQSSGSGKAGLGSCLLPSAATPMPLCQHRRATTPFTCANSAAYLTTGKLGTRSHIGFKNKTSKRAPCFLKNPNKLPPNQNISQVWHKAQPCQKLNQLGRKQHPPAAENEKEAQGTRGSMETTELHPSL